MSELLRGLPPLLASHLTLTLVALLAGVAVSLPLAIAAVDRPRLAVTALAVAGVVQTIPGLALLALMVPLLAETSGLGLGVSAFGFAPALIALILYAVLPILRRGRYRTAHRRDGAHFPHLALGVRRSSPHSEAYA